MISSPLPLLSRLPRLPQIRHKFLEYLSQGEWPIDLISELQETPYREWYYQLFELRFLKEILAHPHLQEIIFHHHQFLQADIGGELITLSPTHSEFLSKEDYQLLILSLPIRHHQQWNYTHPFVSFQLSVEGIPLRATLIHASISPKGRAKLFLRRLKKEPLPLSSFGIPQAFQDLPLTLLQERRNTIFCGATNSGKTTFLRSLLQYVMEGEHLVILEDTHELSLPHLGATYLLSNPTLPQQTLEQFCSYALRLRPDRLILGEIRGPEIIPFILAMNNGHKGLLSTLHASSPEEALNRMTLLWSLYSPHKSLSFEMIKKLLTESIDMIIFLENKKVKSSWNLRTNDFLSF